jgi:hypothetical protein
MYTGDNDRFFPAPVNPTNTPSTTDDLAWDDMIAEHLGLNWPEAQRVRDKINDASLPTEILKCPSDPNNDFFPKSYGANLWDPDRASTLCGIIGDRPQNGGPQSVRITAVGTSSETLVTGEFWHVNNISGARQGKTIYHGWFYKQFLQDPGNANGQALRGHDGRTSQNCLMVDGSARYMLGLDLVKGAPALGANHTGTMLDHRK